MTLAIRQTAALKTAKWKVPSSADLELEYKYEYLLPSRNWPARCRTIGAAYPLFTSVEDFVLRVKGARIVKVNFPNKIHNLTTCSSLEEVEQMVANYAYPRDVKRIASGFEHGVAMPMPVVIQGTRGSWILSGNTRSNVAYVLGIQLQVLCVQAGEGT